MNAIWKVEGAGPRGISERLGFKAPESSKYKRLLRFVVAAVLLMLTCFPVGDLPAASAGCRKVRVRRYVVERPVVVKERCVRRYRTVKYKTRYVPCRRRIVRGYSYYTPQCETVWKEADCGKRLVYKRSNCAKRVVYREPDCEERVVYVKPACEKRVVYVEPDCDREVVYVEY